MSNERPAKKVLQALMEQSNFTLKSRICKLVSKSQAHLGMLNHMIKAQILDQIIRGMNVLVAVLELGLDDKRRRITIAAGRCVIGAGVATLGFDKWDITVLNHQSSVVGPQYE